MNTLQATLANFRGKLLIPLNYQVRNARVEMVPSEGYMYIIAHVEKSDVQIPVDDHANTITIPKESLVALAENDAQTPLVIFLSKILQSNPELLAICKRNRLGYDAAKYPKQPESLSSRFWEDRKREEAFVIKVLKRKKDWKHLREVLDNIKARRTNFKRKRK